MNDYEQTLKRHIADQRIAAEHLAFQQSCHSVAEAAEAAGVTPRDFVKSICLISPQDELIVAIVKGEDRVSTSRVAKALKIGRPRMAAPAEILARTGYPVGGTPAFGYPARFVVDPRVMEKDVLYAGGGSTTSLVRIAPHELLKANRGEIVRVRK